MLFCLFVFYIRLNSGKILLWIHSLFVSLTFCFFVIHPATVKNYISSFFPQNIYSTIDVFFNLQSILLPSSFFQILVLAAVVSWRLKRSQDFHCFFNKMNSHLEDLKHQDPDQLRPSAFTRTRAPNAEKVVIKLAIYSIHIFPPEIIIL